MNSFMPKDHPSELSTVYQVYRPAGRSLHMACAIRLVYSNLVHGCKRGWLDFCEWW